MASAIGAPVESSIQYHWPFGLSSRKTCSPSGVTIRSKAPNSKPHCSEIVAQRPFDRLGQRHHRMRQLVGVDRSPILLGACDRLTVDPAGEHRVADDGDAQLVLLGDLFLQIGRAERDRLLQRVELARRHRAGVGDVVLAVDIMAAHQHRLADHAVRAGGEESRRFLGVVGNDRARNAQAETAGEPEAAETCADAYGCRRDC